MFLLSIALMAVAPTVSKIMQREKEEELIFRGKQYAQAFLNFQKRQGRYPLNLKELMLTHPRSARKLFKEPMCDCDDWGLIRAGEPWPRPKPVKLDSGFGSSTGSSSDSSSSTSPTSETPPPSSTSSPPPPSSTSSFSLDSGPKSTPRSRSSTGSMGQASDSTGPTDSPFGSPGGEEKSNRPIVGVYSKLHVKGLRTFKGKDYYDEWGFIAGQNNDDLPGGLPSGFEQLQKAPRPRDPGPGKN